MPRFINKPNASVRADDLRSRLVAELRSPSENGQPIILEDHTPQTKSIRVNVVWDDWQSVPGDLRTELITQAYREALGDETAAQLRLAMGLTVEEAVEIGQLPYKILSARRNGESPTLAEYEKAMQTLGAVKLNGEGWQVRCRSLDDAQSTVDKLEASLPGSHWVIVQELAPAPYY